MTDPGEETLRFLDRALYVQEPATLIVADLHLGRGATSRVEAPVDGGEDIRRRLSALLERTAASTVVIAGDLLHSFSTIPRGVDWHVTRLERAVSDAGASLVVTPGNHDGMLESVYAGAMPPTYRLPDDETVVCHGHERPPDTALEGAKRIIIGHDHPAVSLGGRKLPCVLYGSDHWRGCDVYMLPAFTKTAAGVTINHRRTDGLQSPLVRDLDVFRPGVYDTGNEEMRWFPPLEACRHLL